MSIINIKVFIVFALVLGSTFLYFNGNVYHEEQIETISYDYDRGSNRCSYKCDPNDEWKNIHGTSGLTDCISKADDACAGAPIDLIFVKGIGEVYNEK